MTANLILEIILIAMGAVMVFCPYDKIKAVFPRAKSERVIKILGIIVVAGGIFAAVTEHLI